MKNSRILLIIPTAQLHDWNLIKTFYSLIKKTKEYEYALLMVKNNAKGFAATVNKGLKIVAADKNYDGAVVLNDDLIFKDKNWLTLLLKKRSQGDIIGIKNELRGCYVPFWCVYIKREVIKKIGLLDEDFLIGEWEDVDYCIRAIEAGFKVIDSDCVVFHKRHGTFSRFDRRRKNLIKKNRLVFLKKYKGTKWEKVFDNEMWWHNVKLLDVNKFLKN